MCVQGRLGHPVILLKSDCRWEKRTKEKGAPLQVYILKAVWKKVM